MEEVRKAYHYLLKRYGRQDWWPAETSYEVVVGAVLTQNTSWKNVEKAISNLKKAGILYPQRILKIQDAELEALIRPSGFYRQKAERLKLATKKWLQTEDSGLGTMELRGEWLSVKGIGKETADSILLYAMDRPIFVIDAYTKRFCRHWFSREFSEYDDYRVFFESNLPKDVDVYKEYHALIVEWGKDFRTQASP